MTRLLLLTAFAASAVGCMGVHATGPMSGLLGKKADAPPDMKDGKDTKDTVARPVPPAILITPGEVAVENPAAALTKLGNELDYDLKNTPPAAKTPIVSRYKNGEKVLE